MAAEKVALVTAGGSGMGAGAARRLAADGFRVGILSSSGKGEALARTGGAGVTTPCATCHGPDLKGIAAVPGIAGRSPSYLVRQLYDFQQRARAGSLGAPMVVVVEKLSHDDMISLAAYAASLKP